MERLSFAEEGTYRGLEASIHIARYTLVRDLCRGRKVLDLACGEGYGSRLMFDWGATEVVGVDVSEEAVASARARFGFGCDGLRYLSGDAEQVEALLAGEKFDLIISLETIEHLHNPVAYIEALVRLRAQDGEIFISCPNDWWYYPTAEQSNPYHIRKYSYDEFLALVTPSLGEPDAIALGLPVTGFINVPIRDICPTDVRLSQIAMMSASELRNALVVPIEPGSVVPGNSSYFVARWGRGGDPITGAGILPVPMDVFRNGLYSGQQAEWVAAALAKQAELQSELDALNRDYIARNGEIADLKLKLQSARVRQAAILVENDVMRCNIDWLTSEKMRLEGELAVASIAAHRYLRLRGMVPAFVVSLGRRLRKLVRGGK